MSQTSQSECFIHSLPTETVCNILKTLLYDIIEDDMIRTPEAKHRVLAGGLPFLHTMALVCRHWRDIVSSTPELWTRIFCVFPQEELRWMKSQLKKTVRYPIHLTVILNHYPDDAVDWVCRVFRVIARNLQRLKSLRISKFYEEYQSYDTRPHRHLDKLKGYAPQLEFLRFTDGGRDANRHFNQPCLKLDCPALRTLHIDTNAICGSDQRWMHEILTHIENMIISYESDPLAYGYSNETLARALKAVSRPIPCLTLDNWNLRSLFGRQVDYKIVAEKVILRTRFDALTVLDNDCQTIVLHQCNTIRDLHGIPLPSFNSLELNGCSSKDLQHIPRVCKWDGTTVTITNSHFSCIEIILYFLGAPFKSQSCSLWPRVTTLKLVAEGDFDMELLLTTLQAMISSRREAAGQENLGKDEEELNSMRFEGVRPIMVLHVHGGQRLSHKEKVWFEERVRDFVWDHEKM
ncbi:hypothetical protein DEU56DRAFT_823546 [Suillus clintonianus]|uniref:uncharacterized protein n=1 Tax=Suillus clintonianus TaxID=1904413 RepID=UPI001B86259D|nr:uncharacterized protein DEU56DRAFT_823546 [Suillus clintonianus]KAG2125972.1 hypothetical protein DEU56DRAFT_823546 [Suillus clintonianus]